MPDSAQEVSEAEKLCSDESMPTVGSRERRRSRRVQMKQPLRVRPSDPKDGAFEEIGTTKNVSQDGVYFVTQRTSYYEGMRLFVTVPYHSPHSPQNYEYLGQIARIDDLGNGQKGMAVRFLSSSAAKRSSRL
jgi:hypothetical protein